jgi:acyl transferase domain-containing protein/aryl carrier-like protein
MTGSGISAEQRSTVIEIWRETLAVSEIDLDRGFADLGGTSLAANRLTAELSRQLGVDLPVIRVFEYPTLRLLLRYLGNGPGADPLPDAPAAVSQDSSLSEVADAPLASHDIAIVGMACRFPGAKNLEEFWANLLDGRDTIAILESEELSPDVPANLRNDPRYVHAAGLIDQPYAMDAEFFDINPMEAKLRDPQQRVLLETAWQALEHAGEGVGRLPERIAVYAGTEDNSYYKAEIAPFPDAEKRAGRFAIMTGNEKDYVAMHIAHKLNLKGPAVSVHTACSTSLVAVIMACKSLRYGECDLALAGGASVHFPTPEGYYYQGGGVFSSDGHCRPFDQAAQGTNFTDGAGVVVLKRVEDAVRDKNTIFAIIKGGAINNDGGEKVSFSAPSVSGQANCIRDALVDAGVDAGTIQYVEAHGTATPVGDPIEVEGLKRAFSSRKDRTRLQYCGLGSVKSNIGHTTAAAGVASLIKTALALKNGVIPATVHFLSPNPALDLENSPFYIVGSKLDWPRGEPRRRAGVSSFGIGGTNSHLVLEEAPSILNTGTFPGLPFEIWPVSAKSAPQRDQLVANLSKERFWPRDVAYTLQHGRARFRHRGARVRLTELQIDDLLVQPSHQALEEPSLAFLFPGQGAQYIEMGKSLYEKLPEFQATFTRCCDVLNAEMGLDFKQFIFDAANRETLEDTRYTQPALFSIEVSLGRMLLDWGIEPAFLLGHSIGEFVAAHLAGVFSLEDALRLIAARGRLMAELPRGRMLSARGALEAVVAVAGEPIDIASLNGPVHCVLSGDNEKIARVQARLEQAGIPCRPLHTSHAFHSAMMSPVVEPFLDVVRSVSLHGPNRLIVSTVTGGPMTEAEATAPQYWANHLRATVKFSPALFRCLELGANVFLEVGPRTTLSSLAVQHFVKAPKGAGESVSIPMLADTSDAQAEIGGIGTALAKLWCAGVELPWQKIWAAGRKVPLVSTYPFERKDYRFSEGRRPERCAMEQVSYDTASVETLNEAASPVPVTASVEQRMAAELGALFSEYSGLAVDSPDSTFVECGFDSLLLMQIGVELGKRYGVAVSLRDLMENQNTLARLATHLVASASPDGIRHLMNAIAVPPPAVRVPLTISSTALDVGVNVAGLSHIPEGGLTSEGSIALREKLFAIREFIDLQISQIVLPAASSQNASAKTPPDLVRVASRIVGVGDGKQALPGGKPLIRAKHAEPPEPRAFRAFPAKSEGAWFVFDPDKRRYRRARH